MTSLLAQIGQLRNANDVISRLISIGNVVIYLLIGFAVLYIVYVTVMYFIKGKEGDESRHEAGMRILYGIVGLFVILSLWGLVNILINTFNTDNNVPANRLPNANFLNSSSAGSGGSQYSQPIGPAIPVQYSQPIGPSVPVQYTQPIGPNVPAQYSQPIGPTR